MNKLDASRWDKVPVEIEKGLNPLDRIRQTLEYLFPELEFAFFTEEDLPDRRAIERYEVMTVADWDDYRKQWNEKMPSRFELHDKEGAMALGCLFPEGSQLQTTLGLTEIKGQIAWKQLFVCFRSKKWGAEKRLKEQQDSEYRFRAAIEGKKDDLPKWAPNPTAVTYESEAEFTKSPPGKAEVEDKGIVPGAPQNVPVMTNQTMNKDLIAATPPVKRGPGRPRKEKAGQSV